VLHLNIIIIIRERDCGYTGTYVSLVKIMIRRLSTSNKTVALRCHPPIFSSFSSFSSLSCLQHIDQLLRNSKATTASLPSSLPLLFSSSSSLSSSAASNAVVSTKKLPHQHHLFDWIETTVPKMPMPTTATAMHMMLMSLSKTTMMIILSSSTLLSHAFSTSLSSSSSSSSFPLLGSPKQPFLLHQQTLPRLHHYNHIQKQPQQRRAFFSSVSVSSSSSLSSSASTTSLSSSTATTVLGTAGTESFRLQFNNDNENATPISPWHDIPYIATKDTDPAITYNMVRFGQKNKPYDAMCEQVSHKNTKR
jgi:hypothetical protein